MTTISKLQWITSLTERARLRAIEWVATLAGLDGAQKAVLYALASMVDSVYETDAEMAEISKRCGLSKRAVQNAIYGCKTKKNGKVYKRPGLDATAPGALSITRRKTGPRQNLSNLYRLGVPAQSTLLESETEQTPANAPVPAEAQNLRNPTAESEPKDQSSVANPTADSEKATAESARKNKGSSNKFINSSSSETDKTIGDGQKHQVEYPEPYFLEKIIYAWNHCLAARGATYQLTADKDIRIEFSKAYRLNTTDLNPKFSTRKFETIDDWVEFFWHLAQSDFLMGRHKLANGNYFSMSFKYILGTHKSGMPRTLLARTGYFHRPMTKIADHMRTKPDYEQFDPKLYHWE